MSYHMQNSPVVDRYFGNPGFLEWYSDKYKKDLGSFWVSPFLDEANSDEKKALDLYFKYLDEYSKITG